MLSEDKKGKKNEIGAYGELVAVNYLKKHGFEILSRNYLKKWGEIDIVAREKSGKVHFIEVKTVSYETKDQLNKAVSYETWRPEENVTAKKLQKLHRVIESWLLEYKYEGEWQIDVVAVRLVVKDKFATVKMIENVIL